MHETIINPYLLFYLLAVLGHTSAVSISKDVLDVTSFLTLFRLIVSAGYNCLAPKGIARLKRLNYRRNLSAFSLLPIPTTVREVPLHKSLLGFVLTA